MVNSNNVKKFLGYLLYTVLIGLVLLKCSQYEQQLKHLVARTYRPLPYFAYISLSPVAIGFLMGLPKLAGNFFKEGTWRFDLIKFVAVGIPALFITTMPFVVFSGLINHQAFLKFYSILHQSFSIATQTVAGIAFGYLLCSVMYKHN